MHTKATKKNNFSCVSLPPVAFAQFYALFPNTPYYIYKKSLPGKSKFIYSTNKERIILVISKKVITFAALF